jgi:hypothetical protein
MKYFALRSSPDQKPARLDVTVPLEIEVGIAQGLPIAKWDPAVVRAVLEDKRTTDMLLASFGYLVVSQNFRAIVEDCAAGKCQFLPLNIKTPRGFVLSSNFFLMNVTNQIDAIDRSKSKYALWTKEDIEALNQPSWKVGRFRDLRVAIFDEKKLLTARLFRQVGWWGVYVDEEMKNRLDKAKMTGTAFYDTAIDPIGHIKAIWN